MVVESDTFMSYAFPLCMSTCTSMEGTSMISELVSPPFATVAKILGSSCVLDD